MEDGMKKSFWMAIVMLAGVVGSARASERHFGYSYESPVLKEGARELETYTTYQFGRDLFYSALQERVEFEVGLGEDVQTSFYLNFKQTMEDTGSGITNDFLADGISNEWKLKLADSVADPVGIGLYAELGFAPDAFELETKLIIDKKSDNWLWAVNVMVEPEISFVANTPTVWNLEPSLGIGYFLSEHFLLGVEALSENIYDGDPLMNVQSTLSVGPVISYTARNWWMTLTALPQVANFNAVTLDLTQSQRWQIRLATSFSL
jgi:hypothetical protein